MAFGRSKKAKNELVNDEQIDVLQTPAVSTEKAPFPRAETGPFDVSEVDDNEDLIDMGSLRLVAAQGLELRLEVEESTQRVIAVTMDLKGSTVQLQPFAAPRSEGLWDEIREQISQSVASQGGHVEEIQGSFGTELIAKLPAQTADGGPGQRVARFVGVDGPRWFLRAVFGGDAALEREAAAELEDLFRKVVVVRGESPMPPRDLLPLNLPKDAIGQAPEPAPYSPDEAPTLTAPERGPETTHIG
ncbi:DUF3710 domain-containing protein [Pseudarthrobacter sp. J1738]|uniref:DUF3710 domain-containing protein n=1 Tax=unclassified Pseudarthrobacter TaxID=2647000 RepID=UPI003D269BE5